MNESTKKILLGVVIVVAVALAGWQGYTFFAGPRLQATTVVGGHSPGHGAKAAELHMQKDAADTTQPGQNNEVPKEAQLGG